ncbi:MAG: SH3 domain-containing protein [Chloroflexota bacterium]|jgi:hypothetical protein
MMRERHFSQMIGPGIVLMALALVMVACRTSNIPPLTVPTIAATAVIELSPAITPPGEPSLTATLPPAPTAVPPTATPPPAPTATLLAAPETNGTARHQVAFVAGNDTLNVRAGPGVDYAPVAQLPPDAAGIVVDDEGQTLLAGSTWVPVETNAGAGWVNSRFLTETVSREDFCGDPAVADLLADLQEAIASRDGAQLQRLVHPERGLRLLVSWWNEEIFLPGRETRALFAAPQAYDWGTEDGSGFPIQGTFAEVMLPRLERDLLGATVWSCDEIVHGPTAGMVILPEGYEQLHFYSAHRPAPAEQEFDWGTWVIGIDRWQGEYYLSYLIHYRYEI